jgi:hypothetical protein
MYINVWDLRPAGVCFRPHCCYALKGSKKRKKRPQQMVPFVMSISSLEPALLLNNWQKLNNKYEEARFHPAINPPPIIQQLGVCSRANWLPVKSFSS